MTYPYVQAAYDYGPRAGPAAGFVVHMAEGGGTVGYLAGSPARGVSVHYVIEYGGRVVQMLDESHVSGSINPTELRTDDDAVGPYGVTACRAVLGGWWSNPNHAVITVEIEGFAAQGPAPAQVIALQALIADVRSRHPSIGLLGHRDFQDYKPCPGKLIPWSLIGGHGPREDPMQAVITAETPNEIQVAKGAKIFDLDGTTVLETTTAALDWRPSPYAAGQLRSAYATIDGRRRIVLVRPSAQRPASSVDCADAVAAEHERTRQQAIDAVTAIP